MRLATIVLGSMLTGTLAASATWADTQLPAQFTNLQVYPANVSRSAFIGDMKRFTESLDVRCDHCHVGDDPDLSTFDFASDAKPAKAMARRMLRMTAAINGEWLGSTTASPASPAAAPAVEKVTCFTCHRGSTRPLTASGGGDR